jgi:hypothetical protein
VESTVEVAEDEELADIAKRNGLARKAGTAGNGEARQGELEKLLNPGGLLRGLPVEESHGFIDCCCLQGFFFKKKKKGQEREWKKEVSCLWIDLKSELAGQRFYSRASRV